MTYITNLMSFISLAWSNLNIDRMFSNHGVEWTVPDEGSVARFSLGTCLDSKGFNCSTYFLLDGIGDFKFPGNVAWQVGSNFS